MRYPMREDECANGDHPGIIAQPMTFDEMAGRDRVGTPALLVWSVGDD